MTTNQFHGSCIYKPMLAAMHVTDSFEAPYASQRIIQAAADGIGCRIQIARLKSGRIQVFLAQK